MYNATFEDLVRFLYRKVWDPDRARDLAQEAFVRGLEESPDNPQDSEPLVLDMGKAKGDHTPDPG